MEILKIFASSESRQYFTDDNGLVWLHGTLLAKRLGYKNPAEAIVQHTEPDERMKPDSLSAMPTVPWFVNEYGIWGMILAAKTAEAKEFKHELKYNILPAIRKEGGYISPDVTKPQAIALKEKLDRILDAPCPWDRMYKKEVCDKAFGWYGANFYWIWCYSWLTTEERCKLNKVNPVIRGNREFRIHQHIEPETRDRLKTHATRLADFVISSTSQADFETRMGRVFGCDQMELDL